MVVCGSYFKKNQQWNNNNNDAILDDFHICSRIEFSVSLRQFSERLNCQYDRLWVCKMLCFQQNETCSSCPGLEFLDAPWSYFSVRFMKQSLCIGKAPSITSVLILCLFCFSLLLSSSRFLVYYLWLQASEFLLSCISSWYIFVLLHILY